MNYVIIDTKTAKIIDMSTSQKGIITRLKARRKKGQGSLTWSKLAQLSKEVTLKCK